MHDYLGKLYQVTYFIFRNNSYILLTVRGKNIGLVVVEHLTEYQVTYFINWNCVRGLSNGIAANDLESRFCCLKTICLLYLVKHSTNLLT